MNLFTAPWLLFDVSYLAHRARFASGDLTYNDFSTGVIFGFWEQVRTICQELDSNKALFFFDSKYSKRKAIFPEYKDKRGTDLTPEEKEQLDIMRAQVLLLRREILPTLGFPTFLQRGFESDDLMAQAAWEISEMNQKAFIITSDNDLYQCVDCNVTWYDPARKKRITPESFRREKGISPTQWVQVKCLAGCSSDDVPGIPGVGEKTAIKYLLKSLPGHHKSFKAIECMEGGNTIHRNKQLVSLPFPGLEPLWVREPKVDMEQFFEFCKRYGFASYLRSPRKEEWETLFSHQPKQTRKRGTLS